jgi:hypothetical protein
MSELFGMIVTDRNGRNLGNYVRGVLTLGLMKFGTNASRCQAFLKYSVYQGVRLVMVLGMRFHHQREDLGGISRDQIYEARESGCPSLDGADLCDLACSIR